MKTTVQKQPARAVTEPAKPAPQFITPDVNILESKEGWTLQAEMPGVSKDGLEVTLEGNELTITGRRAVEPGNLEAIFRESTGADYRRVFELDPSVDTAKINAHMDQGVLTLSLPKAERVKPRKIEIAA